MFRRLFADQGSLPIMLIAFITALTIFLYIAYRALRMSRSDARRIANIPLEGEERKVEDGHGDSARGGSDARGKD